MQREELCLLSDAQMQTFISDGFLVLQPDVPTDVHTAVYDKLQWMLDEDYNPGNNILPRVPEMQQVLDAIEVRGALSSVLGADYVLHPHRFCHSNFPGKETPEGPKVGEGSTTFVGWHQDSHSPLSRPRHHFPNYAMLLYYPQDTPPELGPTQLIPGTQYNRSLSDADRARGIQVSGDAGTCVLLHFDMAHGGSLNVGDHCRHMVKFVFARVSESRGPSWDCRDRQWRPPRNPLYPHDQQAVWKWIWNRFLGDGYAAAEPARSVDVPGLVAVLEGDADLEARLDAGNELAELGSAAAAAVPALIASFSGPEPLRQNAIYALAAIGAAAVPALAEHLETARAGEWSEGAFVLEDSAYALAAMGAPALPALELAARHDDEWVRINALFAIGEMGSAGVGALDVLRSALHDASHRVVRTALDALGQLGAAAAPALSEVDALLQGGRPHGGAAQPGPGTATAVLRRNWSGVDQVHVNAAMALLRMGPQVADIEEVLLRALGDTCGYVDGFAIEALLRIDSPNALRGALRHLRTHRWDDTLIRNVRTF